MDHKISGSVESWSNTYGVLFAAKQGNHFPAPTMVTHFRLDSALPTRGPPESKQTWRLIVETKCSVDMTDRCTRAPKSISLLAGKLYIHAKDLVGGLGQLISSCHGENLGDSSYDYSLQDEQLWIRFLPTGASVEFYVFEDDAGLGAEECALAEWRLVCGF